MVEDAPFNQESPYADFTMTLVLLASILWIGHLLHFSRFTFISQGSLALLTGLSAGGALYWYFEAFKHIHIPKSLVGFRYHMYMDLFLPPIIFFAGFSIKKKAFFRNLGALTTLGVVGTIVFAALLAAFSSLILHILGLDQHELIGNALALGVVFSSSDTVAALQAIDATSQPLLHALVFGEGVVNDATAIVLLQAVQNIRSESQLTIANLGTVFFSFIKLSFLSLLLGVCIGLIAAFILKFSFSLKHSTDREVSLLAVLGFLSYLAAEMFGLSGVFASFFCGLTMSHYAWHSLSPSAKVVSVYTFRVLAFVAELMLFLSAGLDLWSTSLWYKDIVDKEKKVRQIAMLTLFLTLLVPILRAAVTVPLLLIINKQRPASTRVSQGRGAALCWAGTARGAVTLALAVHHFVGTDGNHGADASIQNQIICSACMASVVISTVGLGGITPRILSFFLKTDGILSNLEQHDSDCALGLARSSSLLSRWKLYKQHAGSSVLPVQYVAEQTDREQQRRDADADDDNGGVLGASVAEQQQQIKQGGAILYDINEHALSHVQEALSHREDAATDAQHAHRDTHALHATSTHTHTGGAHALWSKFDRSVLQPIFGGRTISRYRSPPPSPGRWQGASSALRVLQRRESLATLSAIDARRDRQPPPPPHASVNSPGVAACMNASSTTSLYMHDSPYIVNTARLHSTRIDFDPDEALRESLLPPGIPMDEDAPEQKNILEALFSQPGEINVGEELVDEGVLLEGMVDKAEIMREFD